MYENKYYKFNLTRCSIIYSTWPHCKLNFFFINFVPSIYNINIYLYLNTLNKYKIYIGTRLGYCNTLLIPSSITTVRHFINMMLGILYIILF